jgi:NAD(P) transhydrogenase subunit alpha
MTPNELAEQATSISHQAAALASQLQGMADHAVTSVAPTGGTVDTFVFLFAVFMMACFVGYYVVWNVTPALHSPLMGVTNAISSVIVVGAMLATGLGDSIVAQIFGFLAVMLASVNIFGGFTVTQRMLGMFKPRTPAKK